MRDAVKNAKKGPRAGPASTVLPHLRNVSLRSIDPIRPPHTVRSHLKEASGVGRGAAFGRAGLSVPTKVIEVRKLHVGELVVADRPDGNSGGRKDLSGEKIVTALVNDNFGCVTLNNRRKHCSATAFELQRYRSTPQN